MNTLNKSQHPQCVGADFFMSEISYRDLNPISLKAIVIVAVLMAKCYVTVKAT